MATLTLDEPTYAALVRRAESRGLTVERWLAEELAEKPADDPVVSSGETAATGPAPGESLYDAFQRVGAIGFIKGGSTDVATNPKYMEGFGRS